MFICVGNNESFEFAKSVGMGLVDSAIGLTRLILHYAPHEIIFVGSAGSYEYFEGVDSKLESSLDSVNSAFLDSKNLDSKGSVFIDSKNLDSKNATFNKDSKNFTFMDSKDSTLNIGDIFYSTHATQLELSFLESKSYTPIDNSVSMDFSNFMESVSHKTNLSSTKDSKQNVSHKTNLDSTESSEISHINLLKNTIIKKKIPHIVVNSSNYITNTSEHNEAFLRAKIYAENMEFFSILSVAKFFQIPCIGLFCVSNYVCADAHTQFLANHSMIKNRLREFIRENLRVDSIES